jgi:hypothetical protein
LKLSSKADFSKSWCTFSEFILEHSNVRTCGLRYPELSVLAHTLSQLVDMMTKEIDEINDEQRLNGRMLKQAGDSANDVAAGGWRDCCRVDHILVCQRILPKTSC